MLVMDLMERGDLYHLLDRRDKQGRQVFSFIHRGRRVAREIALGLCFLHSLRQAPSASCTASGTRPLAACHLQSLPCGFLEGAASVASARLPEQAAGNLKLLHSLRQVPTGRPPSAVSAAEGAVSLRVAHLWKPTRPPDRLQETSGSLQSLWWGSPAWCLPTECVQKMFCCNSGHKRWHNCVGALCPAQPQVY